jgi:hypothetical protein
LTDGGPSTPSLPCRLRGMDARPYAPLSLRFRPSMTDCVGRDANLQRCHWLHPRHESSMLAIGFDQYEMRHARPEAQR